ncbi:MAG: ABC transporter substrate-binding protein [Candidatus Marinimicrobia bacterium]|nr:ABC transporter substrate-binding protein [Candidatus Neomarinimicrobiota bacterium]
MLKRISLFFLLVVFITCQKQVPKNKELPLYGKTLNISCPASLEQLDPHKLIFRTDRIITSIFYETLLQFSSENPDSVVPWLAEKYEQQGNLIRFSLRKDVYFHNDPCFTQRRQMNADDVIYSIERIARLRNESNNFLKEKIVGYEEFLQGKTERISGLGKIDDYTLEIHLTKPFVAFKKILATPALAIIPKEAVEFYKENFKKHPVGTGAFRLVKWNNLKSLDLVKNEHYWRKDSVGNALPYLDGIYVILISNDIVKQTKLLNNSLHAIQINELEFIEIKKEEDFYNKVEIQYISNFPFIIRFWGISMSNESVLAKNRELRRAIRANFKHEMLESNKLNPDNTSYTMVPTKYFNSDSISAIVEKYKTGKEYRNAELSVQIATNLKSEDLTRITEAVHSVGCKSTLDFKQTGYYSNIFKNHPDIFRVSYGLSYPDFEEYYSIFYSKNIGDNNITCFRNEKYDQLYEQCIIEQDNAERLKLFFELEKILFAEVPGIFFCNSLRSYSLSIKNVKGLKLRMNIHDYSEVWIDENDL